MQDATMLHLTFDQPLWWKALAIIESEPVDSELRKIVLGLGDFTRKWVFSIPLVTWWLGQVWRSYCNLYAPNAVKHIMSGKAISCVMTAHLLMNAAVKGLLLSSIFRVPLPTSKASID